MKKIAVFFVFICLPFVTVAQEDVAVSAVAAPSIEVKGVDIVALYESVSELEQKYQEAKKREQSLPNRILGAVSMGVTGAGGMMLASGLAEQKADKEAEQDMQAYMATFHCDYGAGRIDAGPEEITLPVDAKFGALYMEYVNLANDIRRRKELLGIKPGIESELIIDSATVALYQNNNNDSYDGVYASVADALQKPGGDDAEKLQTDKDKSKTKVVVGGVLGGVGVVGGVVGDVLINKK